MAYIEIAGMPHYYEWLGQEGVDGPSGNRPVMVFVHGWGGLGSLLGVDSAIAIGLLRLLAVRHAGIRAIFGAIAASGERLRQSPR